MLENHKSNRSGWSYSFWVHKLKKSPALLEGILETERGGWCELMLTVLQAI